MLDDAQLVNSLEQHVSEGSTPPHGLHEEGSAALEPSRRCDALLDPIGAISGHRGPLVHSHAGACGGSYRAALVRARCCGAIGDDVEPWRAAAAVHPDTLWRSSEPTALVVFVALSSISRAMGPTTFLPARTLRAPRGLPPPGAAAAARLVRTEAEAPLPEWGDAS